MNSENNSTDPLKDGNKDELSRMSSCLNNKDVFFNASVAELRRKAQEHSEAILKNIQSQQHRNGETTSSKPDADKRLINDPLQSISDVGILNGKIFPKTSLDIGKNLNVDSLIQPNSLPGVIPPMDFSKFPPPNYLSALSNFGFSGFPNLPDFNASPPGLHPKFASNLATLIDKSSDTNLRNDNNLAEVVSIENKPSSPGRDESARDESPDRKLKHTTLNSNTNGDGTKLDG